MPLFKMVGSQCNKFREDKVKVIMVLGEGHMARQCTQPKRPRNASWYKDKAMLAEAQEAGQILDEEQLTEDLDTCDSDCDDISNAKAVLMANISNYGYDVISEEMIVLKEQVDSFKQNLSKQIKEKECLLQTFTIFNSESKEKEDKYMENKIDLEKQIKELDNILFKVSQSAQTMYMLTKPQAFYDNIHKQALGYQNPFHIKKAQRIKPTFYNGIVMSDKHVAMPVTNDNETLILEEESRLRMSKKEKIKGKEIVDIATQKPSANTIVPRIFKLDLEPLTPRMNEAVKIVVQLQSDRLRDEAQAKNEDFLNKLDENIQKIIKEQVKEQVKTSYVVAADLSELELKKILIEKIESNKPGSKRRRAGKELELTSAPKEKTSKTSGKSTEGSKSYQRTASESAPAEEPMNKLWMNPHIKSLRQVLLTINL
nr:hypothetical protein [Tanacetum cinerariifolium]